MFEDVGATNVFGPSPLTPFVCSKWMVRKEYESGMNVHNAGSPGVLGLPVF
ncbi:MAG: hypothetical protein GX316_08620 [Firmicutes bacterium]|nr:hypothetical protein [Bacillota bacterium]